jgi:HNH endonuclease
MAYDRTSPTRRTWRLTDEQKDAMAREYAAGDTLDVLAERYGCHRNNARNIVHRRGVPIRNRGNRVRDFTSDEVAQMVQRYLAGESQQALAIAFQVSQPTISRTLRGRGLVLRARGNQPQGDQHPAWRGGLTLNGHYLFRYVPQDDPHAAMRGTTGYVAEHRLVMARALGRDLQAGEEVHHINGDRQDNRLENLQLRSRPHGAGVVLACRSCGSHDVEAVPIADLD